MSDWKEPDHGWELEAKRLAGLREIDFKDIDTLKEKVRLLEIAHVSFKEALRMAADIIGASLNGFPPITLQEVTDIHDMLQRAMIV